MSRVAPVLVLVGMATLLVAWGTDGAAQRLRTHPGDSDAVLGLVAGAAATACLCGLCAAVLLSALCAVPALAESAVERLAARWVPASLRRLSATLLGVAVVAGTAAGPSQAVATTGPATTGRLGDAAEAGSPDRLVAGTLPSLDRPAREPGATAPPAPTPAPTPGPVSATPGPTVPAVATAPTAAHSGATVVVRPGDTLWSLAAAQLGGDAPPARVAQAWPAWWEANRTVIGADPDLIYPGQVLHSPALP